jgi:membrane protein implicated in regulation of membrane protease activity
MNDWWISLSGLTKLFAAVAIFGSIWQLLFFISPFLGIGTDLDHDSVDSGDNHAADGVKVLSLRALVAGAVGFGWTGFLALRSGMSVPVSCGLAVIGGLIFLYLIYGMMKMLMSLRQDGTLNYENAIGLPGRVYMTVPPRRQGKGQIEVHFQGRLVIAAAVTEGDEPLSPQTAVTVTGVEEATTLMVRATA